jgi:hypothetical protein
MKEQQRLFNKVSGWKPHLNYKHGAWWCFGRLKVAGPYLSAEDAYMNWSLYP